MPTDDECVCNYVHIEMNVIDNLFKQSIESLIKFIILLLGTICTLASFV